MELETLPEVRLLEMRCWRCGWSAASALLPHLQAALVLALLWLQASTCVAFASLFYAADRQSDRRSAAKIYASFSSPSVSTQRAKCQRGTVCVHALRRAVSRLLFAAICLLNSLESSAEAGWAAGRTACAALRTRTRRFRVCK